MPRLIDSIYLNPRDAIQQIAGKKEVITWDWKELVGGMHNNAFTVAKATQIDLLKDIKAALKSAISQGMTGKQFEKHLKSRLRVAGWWGKQTRVNPKTGKSSTVILGTPHRIDNIFRTNIQSSFMAGKWRRFYANRKARPYIEYVAILDQSTRPGHREIHGFIAPINSPTWKRIWPPNGFRCRCTIRALTKKQYLKRRKEISIPSNFPDTGFEGNPGATSDINLVRLVHNKAKRTKSMIHFKKFIADPKRKDYLIDTGIPSIGITGSAFMLNVLKRPNGDKIEITINRGIRNPSKIVETMTALSFSVYVDSKTGEFYVLQKGTRSTYFIFSKTGAYKKTRIVVFFGKRFKKQ